MGIQEIWSWEDGRRIRIYKRGLFWVAYEQSALLLCTKKNLQLRSEQVKSVGAEMGIRGALVVPCGIDRAAVVKHKKARH